VIFDGQGMAAPDIRDWPWPELTPADFKPDPDPNGLQFPHRRMTAAEIDLLDVTDYQGGFQSMLIRDPDGKLYTFSLRPLLPGEAE
jgi:hypothetical protein